MSAEAKILPFDQAVIDFRTALSKPDISRTPLDLYSCQTLAPYRHVHELRREGIEASYLWQLRGLTFEGEAAALRAGDEATAVEFGNARHTYEDALAQYDPKEMPQITTLPTFEGQFALSLRSNRGTV